jgi:hypothetical protein
VASGLAESAGGRNRQARTFTRADTESFCDQLSTQRPLRSPLAHDNLRLLKARDALQLECAETGTRHAIVTPCRCQWTPRRRNSFRFNGSRGAAEGAAVRSGAPRRWPRRYRRPASDAVAIQWRRLRSPCANLALSTCTASERAASCIPRSGE